MKKKVYYTLSFIFVAIALFTGFSSIYGYSSPHGPNFGAVAGIFFGFLFGSTGLIFLGLAAVQKTPSVEKKPNPLSSLIIVMVGVIIFGIGGYAGNINHFELLKPILYFIGGIFILVGLVEAIINLSRNKQRL